MQIKKEIRHGELFPRFYGIAWEEENRRVFICYPVPFNLIAAICRVVYFELRRGIHYGDNEKQLQEAYNRGKRDARREIEMQIMREQS